MPLPVKNKKIDRPSMRDTVYNKLLDWIVEGVLLPGEKVVDKELAAHMGVSRTPVREALRRLEDKNLIESSANRWTRVAKIPPREPEMIYPIIWTLETLALSTAIQGITPEDLSLMKQANEQLETALEKEEPVAASKADAEFHEIFIRRSLNTHLIKILHDLKIRYRRLEVIFFDASDHDRSSIKEHETLMTALETGDLAQAEQTIRSNWKKSLDRLRIRLNAEKHQED